MSFLEHLICNIKQDADILAGCMVLRGHAPDVSIKKSLISENGSTFDNGIPKC